jgi:hypothetical protein
MLFDENKSGKKQIDLIATAKTFESRSARRGEKVAAIVAINFHSFPSARKIIPLESSFIFYSYSEL